MPKPNSFALSGEQVRELVKHRDGVTIHKNTLDRWVTLGLVTPTARAGSIGKGRHRLYSHADVARLRLIVALTRKGPAAQRLTTQRLRLVFAYLDRDEALRAELLNPKTRAELVVDGFKAVVVRPGDDDVELLTGQMRLPLRDFVTGIAQEAARLIA